MLPEGWITYKLDDVASVIDCLHQTPKYSEYGHPMVRVTDIKGGYLKLQDCLLVDDEVYNEFSKNHRADYGDIVFARVGSYGITSYVKEDVNFCLGQNTAFICSTEINSGYLFYYLNSPKGKQNIEGLVTGTTQKTISLKSIKSIEIDAPISKNEQVRIATILSSLDDRIELNLQMNKTLESIARAIFKEWFVDFRFPGFDGELVDGAPKGWRNGKVSDTCLVNTNTLSKKVFIKEILYVEISEVEKGFIKNISIYKRGDEPSRAKRKLYHGDIVISTVRPNRGSYFLAYKPENNLIASTGFAVFTATNVPYAYLYGFLTSDERMDFYGRMADGAAYPSINPSIIMNLRLIIPTQRVLGLFSDTVGVIYERIYENWKQNKILTQIRDSLLPRLMTGKIRTIQNGCGDNNH